MRGVLSKEVKLSTSLLNPKVASGSSREQTSYSATNQPGNESARSSPFPEVARPGFDVGSCDVVVELQTMTRLIVEHDETVLNDRSADEYPFEVPAMTAVRTSLIFMERSLF